MCAVTFTYVLSIRTICIVRFACSSLVILIFRIFVVTFSRSALDFTKTFSRRLLEKTCSKIFSRCRFFNKHNYQKT